MTERATSQEAFPLAWPEGWPRTRPQDRKVIGSWKKATRDYREMLIRELERMGIENAVVSTNVPLNVRGDITVGVEPLDTGVAVYFTRNKEVDYSWQEILGIHEPAPSLERIDAAYRTLAQKYHPDKGGDRVMFDTVTKARDQARDFVNQKVAPYEYAIACDQFKEVRWNLNSIRLTIAAIRQIERCGASTVLDRAFKGFKQIAQQAGPTGG